MAMLVRKEATYQRILDRQCEIKWGTQYDPSIRATPSEAPGASTAHRLLSYSMGRRIHLLSRNELAVAIITLYNPATWYVREQEMLYWDDHEHLMHGHPLSGSKHWPAMRGTWQVARDLGLQKMHPMIRLYSERHGGRRRVPFPYLGDLLVLLRDEAGPYAVNLTVKDKFEDFKRPFNLLGAKTPAEHKACAIARHAIERLAYESAGTRTEQVAGKLIHKTLCDNLAYVYKQCWGIRHFSAEQIAIGLRIAEDGPRRERSPIAIGVEIDRELGLRTGSGCVIVWHGIWTRRVRADLYKGLLPDRPLIPERKDVLVEYAHWFRR